jgi:hypothetical protein
MSEVLDLNDLVKSIEFTVLEGTYTIPPMNDAKMKKVMGISKDITNLSSDERKEQLTEEEEDKLLDLQNTILHEVLLLKEDDKTKQLPKNKYAEWPMRLKNKVLGLIFDQLGSGTPEGETEKN